MIRAVATVTLRGLRAPAASGAAFASARTSRSAPTLQLLFNASAAPQRSMFSSDAKAKDEKKDNSTDAAGAPEDAAHVHIKELEDEIKAMKDKLLRSYAEEENVRRIARRDVENARDYANTKFAKSLLDVADNLERALDAVHPDQRANADGSLKTLLEGVQMTYNGLQKVFQQHGIERFGTVGDKFDPNLHDALCRVPAEEGKSASGTVGMVMKPGYKLKDRVIRAAEVAAVA